MLLLLLLPVSVPVIALFLWVCSAPPHFESSQIILRYIFHASLFFFLVYARGRVLNLFVRLKGPYTHKDES